MLCALTDFPDVVGENQVPLCQIDGTLHYSKSDSSDIHAYTSALSSHPSVQVTKEYLHTTPSRNSSSVFLQSNDSLTQELSRAWYESGLLKVLQVLSQSTSCNPSIANLAAYLYKAHGSVTKFCHFIEYQFNRYSDISDKDVERKEDLIQIIAWHPHTTKMAVAAIDDSVTVYSSHSQITPVLKAKSMKHVSALAWRPLSSCELAVGSAHGIHLWTIDPNSVKTRPSVTAATFLSTFGHTRISSLAWSPKGDVLASAALGEPAVRLWQVELGQCVALRRVGGGPGALVAWAPSGSLLLAATTQALFRVWNCEDWEPDVWWGAGGAAVVAAAWSPCSTLLLFATADTPYLFALYPSNKSALFTSEKKTAATTVADLTCIELPSGYLVGGQVTELAWDPKGTYLAIIFAGSPLVALFTTCLRPQLQVLPSFFINGYQDEYPSTIVFQQDFTEGANLTIGWSSGRVQYLPLVMKRDSVQPDLSLPANLTLDPNKTVPYYSFTSP